MDILATDPHTGADMSNTFLSKVFSVEMLVSLGITLIAFSMGYAVLADDVDEHGDAITKIIDEQSHIQRSVQQARTDIAVIRAQQEGVILDYVEVKSDIKEVLKLIRENERARADRERE